MAKSPFDRAVLIGSVLIAPILLFAGRGLAPQTANVALNEKCLACHGDVSLSGSVHSGLACIDCHTGASGAPVGDVPHPETIPPPDCTRTCHHENARRRPGDGVMYYPDDAHAGISRTGSAACVGCKDCHGSHGIRGPKDPESSVYKANLIKTCGRCHSGTTGIFARGNIHEDLAAYEAYNRIPNIVKKIYIAVISVIVGAFLLFIGADLLHRALRKKRNE